MYNLQKNNYYQKPKSSIVYTPKEVSEFIYGLLTPYFLPEKGKPILDPCCGQGSLLEPWKKAGYQTFGVEIDQTKQPDLTADFLTWDGWDFFGYQVKPQLIICNPPFNGYGNKLGSEVWLAKIIELFSKEIPIVLFAPIGFRLNLTTKSSRWKKLSQADYPSITSIIALPKNIFEGVIFHSEILIFNIKGLQGHYFFSPAPKIEQRTPI